MEFTCLNIIPDLSTGSHGTGKRTLRAAGFLQTCIKEPN